MCLFNKNKKGFSIEKNNLRNAKFVKITGSTKFANFSVMALVFWLGQMNLLDEVFGRLKNIISYRYL